MTVREVLRRAREFLESKGVRDGARLDAELLLAAALGVERIDLYTDHDRALTEEERSRFRESTRRRAAREPTAYILGRKGFCSLDILVDRRALIPRRETEELAELAWKEILARAAAEGRAVLCPSRRVRVLDVGTGSGAVACAIATHGGAACFVTAVDISTGALELARANAERLGLSDRISLVRSDLYGSLSEGERYEVIVSNPPYVREADWETLEPEIRDHEPREALAGGADGLEVIRRVLAGAPARLEELGVVMVEVGMGQSAEAAACARSAGFGRVETVRDCGSIERFVVAREWSASPAG
jgi:release factor glutamine methyltransferase